MQSSTNATGLPSFSESAFATGARENWVVGLALRAAEVAREDDHRALVNEVFYGRQSSDDAGVVADFALVVEGNVEVHAHEDFFALEVYILYSLYL